MIHRRADLTVGYKANVRVLPDEIDLPVFEPSMKVNPIFVVYVIHGYRVGHVITA